MIKHIWSLVCRESKIEAETNNVSIIDAYENLQFALEIDEAMYDKTKPIVGPFNFEVISLFYRDSKDTEESLNTFVAFLDPKGTQLLEFNSKLVFQEKHNRMRNRVKFANIALTTTGTYVVQIKTQKGEKSGKDLVAAIPLDIQITVNGKEV